jgi:predicted nucleotide-binding protein
MTSKFGIIRFGRQDCCVTTRGNESEPPAKPPDPRSVFVIHGRNEAARSAVFDFLRSIGLRPIEWSQAIKMAGRGTPYTGEVLDVAFGQAQAMVVLMTPDEVAYLHPSHAELGDPETEARFQPRPNVLYEAGMAMGRDQDRTVIVEFGQVRGFSDIHGRHVVRLDSSIKRRQDLAERLELAGCAVDLSGRDWHNAGDLTPPAPPGEGLPLGRKLPKSRSSAIPRLDGKFIDNGSRKVASIEIINHGHGDVYQLDVEDAKEAGIMIDDGELPLAKLPAGKSIRLPHRGHAVLGAIKPTHYTVIATGKTVDGTQIREELFVST